MKTKKNKKIMAGDVAGLVLCTVFYVIPFLFMVINSLKDRKGANKYGV